MQIPPQATDRTRIWAGSWSADHRRGRLAILCTEQQNCSDRNEVMAKRSSGSARLRGFAKMPSQGKQPTAEVSTTRFAPSLSEPTRHRRIAVWAALAIGVILFMLSGNDMPAVRWAIVLGAAFFSIIPPLNRWLGRLFDLARCPSPRAKDWTTIGIGLAATAYLIFCRV